jgi:hypothetical protein
MFSEPDVEPEERTSSRQPGGSLSGSPELFSIDCPQFCHAHLTLPLLLNLTSTISSSFCGFRYGPPSLTQAQPRLCIGPKRKVRLIAGLALPFSALDPLRDGFNYFLFYAKKSVTRQRLTGI